MFAALIFKIVDNPPMPLFQETTLVILSWAVLFGMAFREGILKRICSI